VVKSLEKKMVEHEELACTCSFLWASPRKSQPTTHKPVSIQRAANIAVDKQTRRDKKKLSKKKKKKSKEIST
jgi:hypothetical protein